MNGEVVIVGVGLAGSPASKEIFAPVAAVDNIRAPSRTRRAATHSWVNPSWANRPTALADEDGDKGETSK